MNHHPPTRFACHLIVWIGLAAPVFSNAARVLEYDALGAVAREGLDLNGNGALDLASAEPVTLHSRRFEQFGGLWWEVREQSQLVTDGSATEKLTSSTRRRLGSVFQQEEVSTAPAGRVSTSVSFMDREERTRSEFVTTVPAGGGSEALSRNGLLQWTRRAGQTAADMYQYDALTRRTRVTDGRTGAYQAWDYDALGRVEETRDLSGAVTQTVYHDVTPPSAKAGRVKYTQDAAGARVYQDYDTAGRVTHVWGSGTYPLKYVFDDFGQMAELHTYQGGTGWDVDTLPGAFTTATASVTTWEYFISSGRLYRKHDAASKFTQYAYNARGQLTQRTWARTVGGAALTTAYGYDDAGRQTSINYSDATPDVSISYDRAGRRKTLTDAAGAHSYTYSTAAAGQLTGWTVSGTGAWSGLSLGYNYDAHARRDGRTASLDGWAVPAVSYDLDELGRLETVGTTMEGGAALSATYRYVEGAGALLDGITYQQATTTKLVSTRTLDDAGRLEAIAWWDGTGGGANLLSGHDYTLDAVGRRTGATRENGAAWSYGYNDRGEVTSAAKNDAQAAPEPGKQYSYAYDAIGNRTGSAVSGLTSAALTHSTGYTTNALNQYTARANPGRLVLRGRTHPEASVQIDGAAATLSRADGTWDHETAVDNSAGAVRRNLSITATRSGVGLNGGNVTTTQTGSRPVPPASEALTYDDDGNLLSDGHWHYTWDAENRLIRQEESLAILIQPPGSAPLQRRRLDFVYDAGGRRVRKEVSVAEGSSTTFILKQQTVFLYDGWNMIAEYNTLAGTQLVRSYEWGLDMSGPAGAGEGAGGVGGLLIIREHSSTGTVFSSHAPLYDGNGNVMELASITTSTLSARYEYTAFGETISVDDAAIADANPFRFSTKYQDAESGWYYYGYRYYAPELGRWASRDPIEERGGVNIHGMLANNTISKVDKLGLLEEARPECDGPIQGIGIKSFGFGGVFNAPLIGSDTSIGWKASFIADSKQCCKMCSSGPKMNSWESAGGSASITLDVSPMGKTWGDDRNGDDVAISWWAGAKASFTITGEATANVLHDQCTETTTEKLCLSIRGSPAVSFGGGITLVFGQPTGAFGIPGFGFRVDLGLDATVQGGLSVSGCIERTHGGEWRNAGAQICIDASLDVNVNLVFFDSTITLWKGQRCWDFGG